MGIVYDRNEGRTDLPANYWLDYQVTAVLAARLNVPRRQREPSNLATKTAALNLLASRQKQVRAGTWSPFVDVDAVTLAQWAKRYLAQCRTNGIATVGDIETRIDKYVLPVLGARQLAAVKRSEVVALINGLVQEGRLAPRSIHHVYGALVGVYSSAMQNEPPLVASTPCTLSVKRGELPPKRDADRRWRVNALWPRWQIETVLATHSEQLPADRAVFYALVLLTGSRVGEVCGLQVRDYDARARPLPKLVIAEQADGRALKADGNMREVPVHPVLGKVLEQWLERDWFAFFGRAPRPDDPLIPSRRLVARSGNHMIKKLTQDLARLKLPHHTNHDARRTLAALLQEDGADDRFVRAITHEGRARSNLGVFRGYSPWSWQALCDAMLCLRIEPGDRRHLGHSLGHSDQVLADGVAESFVNAGGVDGTRSLPPVGSLGRNSQVQAGSLEYLEAQNKGRSAPSGELVTGAVTNSSSADIVPPDLRADLLQAGDAIRSGRAAALTPDWRERLACACEAAAELVQATPATGSPFATAAADGGKHG
jgi:integrase